MVEVYADHEWRLVMAWDENDVIQLRKLKKEGLEPREIVTWFKGKFSRNAIIGKLNRLGLSGGPESNGTASNPLPLLQLTELTCRWPIGHPGEGSFHFCCKKAEPKKPYCTEHAMVAYRQKSETAAD